jgi:hypothetical protein
MKIQTNIRAGSGGTSGTGQNGTNSGGAKSGLDNPVGTETVKAPAPVIYYAPVSRCVGI